MHPFVFFSPGKAKGSKDIFTLGNNFDTYHYLLAGKRAVLEEPLWKKDRTGSYVDFPICTTSEQLHSDALSKYGNGSMPSQCFLDNI